MERQGDGFTEHWRLEIESTFTVGDRTGTVSLFSIVTAENPIVLANSVERTFHVNARNKSAIKTLTPILMGPTRLQIELSSIRRFGNQ
jgi:hypothetical protein